MLMEADLPDDNDALRAFALEQSRKLPKVTAAKAMQTPRSGATLIAASLTLIASSQWRSYVL